MIHAPVILDHSAVTCDHFALDHIHAASVSIFDTSSVLIFVREPVRHVKMGRTKKLSAARQAVLAEMREQREAAAEAAEESTEGNVGSDTPRDMSSRRRGTKQPSQLSVLRTELEDVQSKLKTSQDELCAALSDYEAQRRRLCRLERMLSALQLQVESLEEDLTESSNLVASLSDELTTTVDELRKTSAQVTRLKRGREKARIVSESGQSEVQAQLAQQHDSMNAEQARCDSLDTQLSKALVVQQDLRAKYQTAQRERLKYKKRAERAQPALAIARKALKDMKVWNPMDGNMYGPRARRLFRRLDAAGVPSKRMPNVLSVVCEELGIKMKRKPSPRLIRRVVKEGGFLSKVKLGRELAMANGKFVLARVFLRRLMFYRIWSQ